MRVEPEVEVLVVVGEVDLGVLGRRLPLEGALLHELGDAGGPLPDRVVEVAVDRRRLGGPDRGDVRPAGEDAERGGRGEAGGRRPRCGGAGRGTPGTRPARAEPGRRAGGWAAEGCPGGRHGPAPGELAGAGPVRRIARRQDDAAGHFSIARAGPRSGLEAGVEPLHPTGPAGPDGALEIEAARAVAERPRTLPGRGSEAARAVADRRRTPPGRGSEAPRAIADRRRTPPGRGSEAPRAIADRRRTPPARRGYEADVSLAGGADGDTAAPARGGAEVGPPTAERRAAAARGRRRRGNERRPSAGAAGQLAGNPVLQVEDVGEGAVDPRGGGESAAQRVDEPRGDAQPIADALIAAGDDPAGAELTPQRRRGGVVPVRGDAAHRGRDALERDHREGVAGLEVGRHRLRDAVAQPVVPLVAGDVGERNDRHRLDGHRLDEAAGDGLDGVRPRQAGDLARDDGGRNGGGRNQQRDAAEDAGEAADAHDASFRCPRGSINETAGDPVDTPPLCRWSTGNP